jgi:hypothetical protein
MFSMRWGGVVGIAGVAAVVWTAAPATAQENGYTNLQVLPADISRAALGAIMLQNLQGLGLPRRSGEGCLHCHAGSTDTPRNTWDYASDEKPAKARARVMMAMVRDINEEYLTQIDDRIAPTLEVGCYTCHAGRIDPTPLTDLLLQEYEGGGVDAMVRTYRATRARYFAADAYDFRVGTLVGVANQLAGTGQLEDAASVHELNIEYYQEPQAYGGLIQLRVYQALLASGPDAMVARYHRLKAGELPAEAFTPQALDPLGWVLQRSERQAEAMVLFELNYAEYPDVFGPTESLAYAVSAAGDPERGFALAEAWIAANPDHVGGQQLLSELRILAGR